MLLVGVLLGFGLAVAVMVPLLVLFDRRAERRDRIRLRVDQMPQPLPGAYERVPERALTAAHPGVVIDAEPDRED